MKLRTGILVVVGTAAVFAAGLLVVTVIGRALQAVRNTMTSEAARQSFTDLIATRSSTFTTPSRV